MAKLMEISGISKKKKVKKKKAGRKRGIGTGTKRAPFIMAPGDTMSPLSPIGSAGTYKEQYQLPPTGTRSDLLPPTPGNIAGIKNVQDAETAFKSGNYSTALRLANKAAKSRNVEVKSDAKWIQYRVKRAKRMGVKMK